MNYEGIRAKVVPRQSWQVPGLSWRLGSRLGDVVVVIVVVGRRSSLTNSAGLFLSLLTLDKSLLATCWGLDLLPRFVLIIRILLLVKNPKPFCLFDIGLSVHLCKGQGHGKVMILLYHSIFLIPDSSFQRRPSSLEISALCLSGETSTIFLLSSCDQTIKAFIGLLMWLGGCFLVWNGQKRRVWPIGSLLPDSVQRPPSNSLTEDHQMSNFFFAACMCLWVMSSVIYFICLDFASCWASNRFADRKSGKKNCHSLLQILVTKLTRRLAS